MDHFVREHKHDCQFLFNTKNVKLEWSDLVLIKAPVRCWNVVVFNVSKPPVFSRWGYVKTPGFSWRTVLRTSWISYLTLTSTWGWFCANTRRTRDLPSSARMTISKCTSTAWWRNPKEPSAFLRKPKRECMKNSHRTGKFWFTCGLFVVLSVVLWNERIERGFCIASVVFTCMLLFWTSALTLAHSLLVSTWTVLSFLTDLLLFAHLTW